MVSNKTGAILKSCYDKDDMSIEVGIDEAGRGPMLGRVYSAAVILPKDDSFKHEMMKDSKRFHSEKKIKAVAEYIKNNAIDWKIAYCTEQEIDEINIRNSTHKAMHKALKELLKNDKKYHLLVDGNDFKPYVKFNETIGIVQVPHTTVEGGDNKYASIAAASILAKVARDEYIEQICVEDPSLNEKYQILKNKGYGTRAHMNGIQEHGISKYHRRTFGICQNYNLK